MRITLLLIGVLVNAIATAQCPNDNFLYVDMTPGFQGATETETCVWAGEYVTVNVIAGETYQFQTCNANPFLDTQITLYNNSGGGSLAYDDDGCGLLSTITWVATFTGTVRVLVDEWPCVSNFNCIRLDVTWVGVAGSCNDVCLDAIPLSTDGTPHCGNNLCATLAGDYSLSCGFGGDDTDAAIWFSFVAPPSGSVIVSTDFPGTDFDTQINLLGDLPGSPTNCPAVMYEYGCDEDGGTNFFGLTSVMSVSGLTPGQTYWIQLDGFMGETGQYCINVTENPCAAYVGTFTVSTTGNATVSGNTIFVCNQGTACFDIETNGDYILPPAANFGPPGPPCVTSPELMYALYATPPITGDPEVDANFSGLFWTGEDFSDCNPSAYAPTIGSAGSTWYFVPVTVDDGDDDAGCGGLQVDANNDGCYDYGAAFEVHYLNQIQANISVNTCGAFATITITGGSPQVTGSNYTLIHSGAGTLSSTSVGHNGSVTVSGLTNGSSFSINVTDPFGCDRLFNFGPITVDNVNPTITCPGNQTLNVNASCQATLPDYTGLASANDNCPGVTVSQSPAAGTTVGVGTTPITLTATDAAGNTASCNFSVVVSDNINPTITCPGNQTLNVNASCQATLPNYAGLATANDNCPGVSVSQSPAAGTIVGVGTTLITLTATDAAGNTASCNFNVIVSDNTPPNAICQNLAIDLDVTGNTSITAAAINNGSTDNCGIASLSLSQTAFDCSNLGANNVVLTVIDLAGNTSTCNATVTVSNPFTPTVNAGSNTTICANQTVSVSATLGGSASSGVWSTSGDGAFANANLTSTTYTPGSNDISSGVVDLIFTTNLAPCAAANDQIQITINPVPVFTLISSNDPSACGASDGSIVIGGLQPSSSYQISYQDGGTPIDLGNQTTTATGQFTISNLDAGSYSNISVTSSGCTYTLPGSTVLTDPASPTFTILSSSNPSACGANDGSITLQGFDPSTNYSISYFNGSSTINLGSVTTDALGNYQITGLPAGTYSNFVALLAGCSGSLISSVTLTDPATPAAPVAGTNATYCQGDVIVNLTATAGSGGTLTWYDNVALTNVVGTGITHTPSSSVGTHNYYVTETLANCESSATLVTVVVNPTPVAPLAGTNATYCQGDVIANLTATAGSGGTLTWYNDVLLTNIVGTGTTFTPSSTVGTHNYYITETSGSCESDATEVTIIVNPTPGFLIASTQDPATCGGTEGFITLTGLNASTSYEVTYTDNSGLVNIGTITTNASGEYVITVLGADTYSNITVTLGSCSSSQGPVMLSDPNAPTFTLSSTNPTTCGGADGSITLEGLDATTTYDISYNNGIGIVNLTGVTTDASGNYVITGLTQATYANFTASLAGCFGSQSGPVVLSDPSAPATPSAGTNATYCQNDAIADLTAIAGSGGNLTWYDDVALTNVVGAGGTFSPSTAVGTHNYYVTESLANCESTATLVTIIINTTPVAPAAGPDGLYCEGEPVLNISGSPSSGGTINWYNDAGLTNQVGTGNSLSPNNTVGTHTYYATESLGNCESDATEVIVVVNPTPTFSIEQETNPTTCGSSDGSFTITGLDPTITYQVTYNSGGTTIDLGNLTPNASGSITVGNLAAGTYSNITVTLGLCSFQGGPVILVSPGTPDAPQVSGAATYCEGQAIAPLTASTSSGGTITWYADATLNNVINSGTILNPDTTPGTQTYYVTETADGCESAATMVTVQINPTPADPTVSGQGEFCNDAEVTLTAQSVSGTISWYTDAALTNLVQTGGSLSVSQNPGSYSYYVIASIGNCFSNSVPVTVLINECDTLQLEIPTAFTPNFDGVNDTWEIPGLKEIYPNNRVLVYNRWGNLIFESEGYDTPWDGTYNGEPLPVGSYFFIIDFNDGVKEQERGTVTIVKKN